VRRRSRNVGPAPLLGQLRSQFLRRFGRAPELGVRAPGRVNLIGEHTDYNGGLVLPCAIDRDTVVLAVRREDRRFRVFSIDLDRSGAFDASAPERRGDWLDYVMAPVFALGERGIPVAGLDLGIASRVPLESGLSSSAALGVAVASAIDRAQELGLDSREIATVAHRGESEFVGVGCGIMDQFASALGRPDHALRLDCRSLEIAPTPLAEGRLRILIAQSGVRRALADGGYRRRVAECASALTEARDAGIASEGASALRDLVPDDLPALEKALAPLLFRRTRHVITENARVDAVCERLAARDLEGVGALLVEGMRSLRDDYQVSTPELDVLCELGDAHPGCYGSRLTGAGFGGCTVHLVEPEAAEEVAGVIASGFEARFGRRPAVVTARAAAGAGDLAI
jgi:galactokinase